MKGRIFRFKPTGHFVSTGQDMHGAATHAKYVDGMGQFESNLGLQLLRNPDWKLKDGRIVHGVDLRDYSVEELEGKELVEGTGYYVPVKDFDFKGSWLRRTWLKFLYRNGTTKLNLGSGLTTNIAALAIANDWNWAAPSGAAINVLKLCNYHASGTGSTAAAATDIKLQTASSNGGQNPVAGTQSLISAANSQKLQTVATIAYTGTETVSEWGLFNSSTLSTNSGIGSPFTATTASSATVTGTPLTASSSTVQGMQQSVISSDTTAVWMLCTSNTTSVLNGPAWYKTADGTLGSTPGATEAYHKLALMLDHKVFTGIGVNNGDSIQYTYQLTIASGN